MDYRDFWAWVLPDFQSDKKVVEGNKKKKEDGTKSQEVPPEISTEPAKGNEPHMLLGKELEALGVKPRARDADGLGALQPGSPWIAPIDKLDSIFQALRKKGYLSSVPTPKQLNPKKGASFRKPQSTVMVEMGMDGKNVYLYITDDNEKKK